MAEGDFIIRLDSDDMLKPEFAEQLSNQLVLFPEAGYAHAAVQQINQYGNFKKIRNLSRQSGYQDGNSALKYATRGFKVAANIIIYKKEVLKTVNYALPSENFAEDYYLATAISAAGYGNVYLDKVLSEYRVWDDVGKIRKKRKLTEISGLHKVITDVLEPAYKSRNWSEKPINHLRKSLAIQHSDCLSWSIYSESEKRELKNAIFQLDSSMSVKIISSLYQKGFGFTIDSYKYLIRRTKLLLKGLYSYYRKLNPRSFSAAPMEEM